jgi:hypothetical protein
MVDLGGIRNLTHQHDPQRVPAIGFETTLEPSVLKAELSRSDWDNSPFFERSRFSLLLRLRHQPPSLREIEIGVNDSPLMTLEERAAGTFGIVRVESGLGVLGAAADRLMIELEGDGEVLATAVKELLPDTLGEQDVGVSDLVANHRALVAQAREALGRALAAVLSGGRYGFESGILRDALQGSFDSEEISHGDSYYWSRHNLAEKFAEWGLADKDKPYHPEARAIRYGLSRFVGLGSRLIAEALDSLVYLGPVRHVPPRLLIKGGNENPQHTAGGDRAWKLVLRDARVRDAVNRFLGPARLDTPYRLRLSELVELEQASALNDAQVTYGKSQEADDVVKLMFEDGKTGVRLSHRDIGFGVVQVLPILVNAAVPETRLIAIEQPELHLHPRLQAELGDVFIESALGERKNTFLLETHSEHLILRVMRRMRETHEGRLPAGLPPVRPEDVSIVFVEPGPAGSIAREMPLNARGELLKAWPGGFFEEGLEEILA